MGGSTMLLPLSSTSIMKTTLTVKCFLICFMFALGIKQPACAWQDISRGHQAGEIFFVSGWYWLNDEDSYNVVCYTDDYGQTLTFKYICNVYLDDMQLHNIINDATDGVFYNYVHTPYPAIYISYDHCATWEECNGFLAPSNFYTSGNEAGIIYTRSGQYPGLYKSYDYANTFEQVKEDSVYGFLEVGTVPSEIYFSWGPSVYHPFEVFLSDDGGSSFGFINDQDSSVAGINLMGHYPRIFRGSNPGELYLVSWHLPENFKIFYSQDYGYNFELRYESPQCNFYFEGYVFTPGYEQGTFYYIKGLPWYDNVNTKLHIFYSSDTAKTFTEHIHILDSTFPVNIYEEELIKHKTLEISNYPNPFSHNTTITFNLDKPGVHSLELTSLSGQAVLREEKYFEQGQQSINLQIGHIPAGIYLYSIKLNGQVLGVKKIVKR